MAKHRSSSSSIHGGAAAAALVTATALLLCATACLALTPDGRCRTHYQTPYLKWNLPDYY
jgi:hypothetical protein